MTNENQLECAGLRQIGTTWVEHGIRCTVTGHERVSPNPERLTAVELEEANFGYFCFISRAYNQKVAEQWIDKFIDDSDAEASKKVKEIIKEEMVDPSAYRDYEKSLRAVK